MTTICKQTFWVSAPSQYDRGWMTVAIDVLNGIVKETYAGWPELRGMEFNKFCHILKRRHGNDNVRIHHLESRISAATMSG